MWETAAAQGDAPMLALASLPACTQNPCYAPGIPSPSYLQIRGSSEFRRHPNEKNVTRNGGARLSGR